MNKQQERFVREWNRRNQKLLRNMYADADLVELMSPEEVKEDLLQMGIDPHTVPGLWEKILAKTKQRGAVIAEAGADIRQRPAKTAQAVIVEGPLRWLKDLRDYVQPQPAGARLGVETAAEEPPKELLLTEHGFSAAELAGRLPWAKPLVRLSKTGIDREKGTALFLASVPHIKAGASKKGVLRVVLVTPSGGVSQVRLTADERKKIFEGVELPLDSSGLRYGLSIE